MIIFIVATIGFAQSSYIISESDGSVNVTVRVLSGQLGRSVTVRFATMDGTAVGMCSLCVCGCMQ